MYFNELVNALTKKLKNVELPAWNEIRQLCMLNLYPSRVPSKLELPDELPENEYSHRLLYSIMQLDKPEDFIYSDGNVTWFEFQIAGNWLLKDKQFQFDKIKKEIQALIREESKYKTYALVNTWNYTLTKEEVREFDIFGILSGIAQQIRQTQINYNPRILTPEQIVETQKFTIKSMGLDLDEIFLVLKNITLQSSTLDSLFPKIEYLLDYLYPKGLIEKPDLPDVRMRYIRAIEDSNKNSISPNKFVFFISCWPRRVKQFLLMKDELFDKLKEMEYEIRLDSNPLHSDRYGCYCGEIDK
jgi:hypothetical protein